MRALLWLVLMGFLSASSGNLCIAGESPAEVSTFQVGDKTEITLDGEGVSLSKLKVGMQAYVTPDSFQDGYAAIIDAHTFSPGSSVPPPKGKPKGKTPAAPPADKHWIITALGAHSITVTLKSI